MNLDSLAQLIDGGSLTAEESVKAESEFRRLANEVHALRIENRRLRDAIETINCALDALNLMGV